MWLTKPLEICSQKDVKYKDPFIGLPEIYYAIAIAITFRLKNGLCTQFYGYDCDCDYYSTHRKESQSRNKSEVWMNHMGTKEDIFWVHSYRRFITRLPLPLGSRMGCAHNFTIAYCYSTYRKESQSQSRYKSQVWINHKGTKEDAFFLHS